MGGPNYTLVVIRFKDRDNLRILQTDYYLSNASPGTDVAEFARAAKAEHRIEECIQRAKSEAGLGWPTTKFEAGRVGIIIK